LSRGEPSRPTLRLSTATILRDAYKSRFLADFYIGDNPAMVFEYYHPFNGSAYFVAPGFSLARDRFPIYDGEPRDETRDRIAGSFYFGVGTWRHIQVRFGANGGVDRYSDPVNTVLPPSLNTGFVNPEVRVIVNTQDSGLLPTRGFRLNGSGGWSFRENSFPYVRLDLDHFHPMGTNVSLFVTGRADSSLGYGLAFYDQFTTGGLSELDAYRYQEFRGDTVLTARGGLFYRGANPNTAVYRPIFGAWYEAARVDRVDAEAEMKHSTGVGVFTPTPLGLAGLTFSFDLKGSTRFRLSIGSFWNRP
jgi:outer membrane protein assembly factor BamA